MTSVYFDPAVGGDGSTVTDDANPTTGLANGGHRSRFVAALVQMVAIVKTAVTAAQAATNAPGTYATSTTSLALATGAKTLTIQTGRSIVPGMQVLIAYTTTPTKLMRGTVTAYNSSTGQLDVTVDYASDTGTYAAWTISLTGVLQTTKTINGQSILGVGNITTGLTKTEVSGTTQTTAANVDYMPTGAACAFTANPSPVDGEEFAVTPINGQVNTIDFGSATVRSRGRDFTGVITMTLKIRLRFIYSTSQAKWINV